MKKLYYSEEKHEHWRFNCVDWVHSNSLLLFKEQSKFGDFILTMSLARRYKSIV